MICIRGPPWLPGKQLSQNDDIILISPFVKPNGLGKSLPIIIKPPRGPRNVFEW
jgi:hypothetical protein